MEKIDIVGKNDKTLSLKNIDDLEKVYQLIIKDEDFIIIHPDYSEVFSSSNFSSKLKNGEFKLNVTKKLKED